MGVVDGYTLDYSLVQLPAGVVVPLADVLLVDVGRMTHLDRVKNAEMFASPTSEVFESHIAIGISNKKSSPTAPHAIPNETMTYISAVESK
ncbi:hypothetical protein J1N35_004993 [Gossypium stocksii]|uniref:Uncharacterized protein n=1 Tax=Gossypium stocksii TaxID=47602 RepID=A0A9D4AIJ7_9ROSI|nr:hypothetical protein J1N35_004993 [Gossypium stocksii]